ncbi:MAG TPA: polymer-forming cytoskeletal protein [Candidatus Solibacter sp.]|nr:polymer-forming cytoskeletal protein [Candidatus Solibacter sp.]
MWRKEDGNPQVPPEGSSGSMNANTAAATSHSTALPLSGKASACISQGIKIKGELNGSEDLFIDGVVDGKIHLANSVLTVGPNATVKAEITSRELVIRGRTEGKLTAAERIQIWNTARVHGDLKAERVSIEEGAEVRGKLEAGKASPSAEGAGKKADVKKDPGAGDQKSASGAATAGAN